jgi:hypothetical protein
VELLGTYLESQGFKDAMEKGIAEYVSNLPIERPVPYLHVAFVAEATAAKALIDAWLQEQLAEMYDKRQA